MEVLAVFDEKNYDDTTKVYEKYNVRGVIFRDGKIAMQCSTDGEYKMPGSMCQGIGIMAVGSVADHTGWLVCDTEITVLIENPYAGRIT